MAGIYSYPSGIPIGAFEELSFFVLCIFCVSSSAKGGVRCLQVKSPQTLTIVKVNEAVKVSREPVEEVSFIYI